MKAQRLRVRFRVEKEAAELPPREMSRAWEEAAINGGLPLAYSEGRRRTPQVSLAAPLPRGVTSDCELADLALEARVRPADALGALNAHLPPGIEASAAWEVGLASASLPMQVRWADYEAAVPAGADRLRVQRAIDELLASATFPWEHHRETKVRRYDLRPLVIDAAIEGEEDGCLILLLRLRAEQESSARADQVIAALGLPPACRIHRRRLHLESVQPAVTAYRRAGEPDSG